MQLAFMSEALAHEAKAANAAKETRFTVVVGNPPYAVSSSNRGPWIERLTRDFKINLDGERNLQPLADDYLKFFRLSFHDVEQSGAGVVGYITNREYLPGVLHRSFRSYLISTFDHIVLTDLGGQLGVLQNGVADENVFEIRKGVSVALLTRRGGRPSHAYRRLTGTRESKYEALSGSRGELVAETIVPAAPSFSLLPASRNQHSEYSDFAPVPTAFVSPPVTGFATHRDHFAIALDRDALTDRVGRFADLKLENEIIRSEFELDDTRDWKLSKARKAVAADKAVTDKYQRFSYRPFDDRWVFYSDDVLEYSRRAAMQNIGDQSLALITSRIAKDEPFHHVFISAKPLEKIFLSAKSSNNAQVFLSATHSKTSKGQQLPNIAPVFAARVAALTGLAYDDCVEGPKRGALGGILPASPTQTAMFAPARRERGEPGKSFGPRDLFDYIYAVLHSPAYRARYADYLKSDFARIPLPGSAALFEALVPLGTELVALHLLDDALPILKDPKGVRLAGSGEARVTMAAAKFEGDAFENGRMYISASKSRWFETVPQAAADFHVGGYRPARKWLKDRAAKGGRKASPGRLLTEEDVLHYRRMIVALTRTAELMPRVDAVVDEHGGWPGAFRGMTDQAA